MTNDISIAMATYNGSKYIEQQLFSIINQKHKPKEIIIFDDGSTDATVAIIKKIQQNHPLISLFENEQNLGIVKTFKKAILACNSDYIALSDQDDIWEKEKLAISFDTLKKSDNNTPSIVFSDLKMIGFDGTPLHATFWETQGYNPSKITLRDLLIGNIVTGCTIMMNKKMKAEIEKMPDAIAMHDYWLALLAFTLGNFIPIFQTPIQYRMHQNSATIKHKITVNERMQLFFKIFSDKQKEYLSLHIEQAQLFFDLYKLELSDEKRKDFITFLKLKNQNSIYRKWYAFKTKYIFSLK